jgi:SAM-dependent methyltransferase
MPWYEDWFDRPEYEAVYPHRDEGEAERAADLIERVAEPSPGARLLDIGCGRGRHARAFARRGYRVTGIDLSTRAIEDARERAATEGLSGIDFRKQDMRAPMGKASFDGTVNLFSSFGYFGDGESDGDNGNAEHQQVIERVAAALREGGFFVQDFLNAPSVRAGLVPEDTREAGNLQIREQRWIEGGRINKEITLRPGDGPTTAANGHAPRTFRESVRLLELADFRRFYEQAGLRLEATFGDYDGAPYDEQSPRLIMLSRKTGETRR